MIRTRNDEIHADETYLCICNCLDNYTREYSSAARNRLAETETEGNAMQSGGAGRPVPADGGGKARAAGQKGG